MVPLKGKRIFYVEDNVPNRALAQLLLEQHGAAIHFERWGNEADIITRLRSFMPVDLVLLDLMFPGKVTGYDIYDDIRCLPEFNAVPIVAISAADPSIEMPKARAKGFAGYISKPISLMQFPRQVADLINGQHIWYAG
jgi:two-component system cell cycle response regulator DivK